ncbi:MAG: hypothetical protein K6A32_00515 [Bacteroidales bacterium]|nr:hypothetical protein [Bacteroidales bacterium]
MRLTENIRRLSLTLAFLLLAGAVATVDAASKEPRMTRVYMFGFSASLTDSTAFQTDIQTLDSAWIDPSHKFLIDRALYSLQLQYHVEVQEHRKNTVCTVFFGTNLRKVQRRWAKVRKRYENDPALRYQILPEERFRFKAEEYKPVIIGEPEEVAGPASTPAAPPSAPQGKGPGTPPNRPQP